jgi:putative ABC transport system permease protein
MLKFNLKLVLRNLLRQRTYSLINLAGLSIGLAGTFILLLYISTELGFDKHNKLLNHIYRINQELAPSGDVYSTTPYVLCTTLRSDIPETFKLARYINIGSTSIRYDNKIFNETSVYCADNELFNILTFDIIQGNQDKFLKEPNSVVITKKFAKKYFGDLSPLGKVLIMVNNDDVYTLTVTGVIKDIPVTSTFRPDIITNLDIALKQLDKLVMSTDNVKNGPEYYSTSWPMGFFFTTLVYVPDNYKPEYLEAIMAGYEGKHFDKEPFGMKFKLQPYKGIYFNSDQIKGSGDSPNGNSRNIYIYSVVALLIMLTASFNYILLSTSISEQRLKEIGLRMTSGASRLLIIRQILGETIFISLIALPFGISITELLLPHVSAPLFNKLLTINYIENWHFTLGLIIITLIIGIGSGSYLAIRILSSNPVDILKKTFITGSGKSLFTKTLNIAQLTIAIILIICTGTIYNEIKYFKSSDLGFRTKNIISIKVNDDGVRKNYESIKNKIKSSTKVENVSGSMWDIPTGNTMGIGLPRVDDKTKMVNAEGLMVDYNFASTLGLRLLDGRDFSQDMGNEGGNVIINNSAVKALGIKEPIGTKINFGTIVGVVEDFHIHSFRNKIPPMILLCNQQGVRRLLVKFNTDDLSGSVSFIKGIWNEFAKDKPLEYTILNDSINELYSDDNRFGKTLMLFSGLTLFIALLGIFGMSMINAEKKTKEIGIRKVMGAAPKDILTKLSVEFMLLILISVVVAFPVAYLLMNKWLQNFEYHRDINLWIFVLAGIASASCVFLTVSYQVNRTANSNPVDTLKYE